MPHPIRTKPAHRVRRGIGALSLALLAASCGESTRRVEFRPNAQLARQNALYTLGESDGTLNCTLQVERDPRTAFGYRLPKVLDVVAVKLTVELLDSSESNAKLSWGNMVPVLFLEDGTALKHWKTSDLISKVDKDDRSRVQKASFVPNLLQKEGNDSSSKLEGYLFFRTNMNSEGEMVLDIEHGEEVTYTVDVRRSMLQFDYTRITGGVESVHTFNVGAQ